MQLDSTALSSQVLSFAAGAAALGMTQGGGGGGVGGAGGGGPTFIKQSAATWWREAMCPRAPSIVAQHNWRP